MHRIIIIWSLALALGFASHLHIGANASHPRPRQRLRGVEAHSVAIHAVGIHCGSLTSALVKKVARDNTLLVTIVDKLVWHSFGPSYVENIRSAGITYWLIAALDPETSTAMGAQGITDHCFNAPQDRINYKGSGEL
eukprot:XP_001697687.1 predicted protein [Chlamydomonas reinhardtii]